VESRPERDRTRLFYAEGMRFVARALDSPRHRIETALYAPGLHDHPFALRLLDALRARGVPVLNVSPAAYRRLSLVDEPQGIAVVVRQRWERLHRVAPEAGLCWLVLDTVRAPGNLGTVIRTLDAVGAAGVILLGGAVDPYAPQVVRATMGAVFAQRFVRATEAEFARWRARHGVTLVGTSPHAAEDYHAFRYPAPLALWMGGERAGLSEAQQGACDAVVRIPMAGHSDSLNLATATSVLLYEVFNQRRAV